MNPGLADFARRVSIATGVVVLVVAMVLFLWYAVDVLLVVFAGLLLAIFVRGLSDWLSAHTRLPDGWALAVVGIALFGLLAAAGWLLATELGTQVAQLAERLPRAVQALLQSIEERPWGGWLLDQVPQADALHHGGTDLLATVGQFFFTPLGALVNAVILGFVGLYVAVEPSLYLDGLVRLVPPGHRPRARTVLFAVRHTLQWWLLGKLVAMAAVGLLTGVGLWLLGVPLALTFGLLAALLTFIPNFGPLLSLQVPHVRVLLGRLVNNVAHVKFIEHASHKAEVSSYLATIRGLVGHHHLLWW
jgi:predicted PurR-regulated permease PerM